MMGSMQFSFREANNEEEVLKTLSLREILTKEAYKSQSRFQLNYDDYHDHHLYQGRYLSINKENFNFE